MKTACFSLHKQTCVHKAKIKLSLFQVRVGKQFKTVLEPEIDFLLTEFFLPLICSNTTPTQQ